MVLETKRKRVNMDQVQVDSGVLSMQMDGPQLDIGNNLNGLNDPKNLQGVGLDTRPTEYYEFFRLELS